MIGLYFIQAHSKNIVNEFSNSLTGVIVSLIIFRFQIYDLYVCTSIRRYECADRNWYFGYNIPEGDDFVSYHYTTNIRDITITCNNHS